MATVNDDDAMMAIKGDESVGGLVKGRRVGRWEMRRLFALRDRSHIDGNWKNVGRSSGCDLHTSVKMKVAL